MTSATLTETPQVASRVVVYLNYHDTVTGLVLAVAMIDSHLVYRVAVDGWDDPIIVRPDRIEVDHDDEHWPAVCRYDGCKSGADQDLYRRYRVVECRECFRQDVPDDYRVPVAAW